jgi:Holliday junction resolvase RusA-like endonuclease
MKYIFDFDIMPTPLARPRICKGGYFYSPSSGKVSLLAKRIRSQLGGLPSFGDEWVKLSVEFGLKLYTKKGARLRKRGDIDNFLKFLLDAIQESKLIDNDIQIIECNTVLVNHSTEYIRFAIESLDRVRTSRELHVSTQYIYNNKPSCIENTDGEEE